MPSASLTMPSIRGLAQATDRKPVAIGIHAALWTCTAGRADETHNTEGQPSPFGRIRLVPLTLIIVEVRGDVDA